MDFGKSMPADKSRSIFEKKYKYVNLISSDAFRLNDGTKTFVEANTLLEPANNSSAV